MAPFVDLEAIGKSEQLSGYTGADLAALVRETGVIALKEYMLEDSKQPLVVTSEHFKKAISKIRPSVSEKVSAGRFRTCNHTFCAQPIS